MRIFSLQATQYARHDRSNFWRSGPGDALMPTKGSLQALHVFASLHYLSTTAPFGTDFASTLMPGSHFSIQLVVVIGSRSGSVFAASPDDRSLLNAVKFVTQASSMGADSLPRKQVPSRYWNASHSKTEAPTKPWMSCTAGSLPRTKYFSPSSHVTCVTRLLLPSGSACGTLDTFMVHMTPTIRK